MKNPKEGKQSWTFNKSIYLPIIYLSVIYHLPMYQSEDGIFQFTPC